MNYYNAIVITDYDAKITYRNISGGSIKRFVEYCLQNLSTEKIFFYRLPFREAKTGHYCGYYNKFKGLQIS